MANKDFHRKVFKTVDEVKKILPAKNGGVVVIEEKYGLEVRGEVLTEKDGNYKRDLGSAKAGVKMLNPGKKVEIIMA